MYKILVTNMEMIIYLEYFLEKFDFHFKNLIFIPCF